MNVQEVLNIAKARKLKNKELVKKIIANVHKKIKYYATLKKESCVYTVPPIVDEFPVYDFENTIKDIFKILDSEGYIVTAYPSGELEIIWNEKLVEQKVKTDAFILSQEERRLKNITKKCKKVDERFSFLANPKKIKNEKDKTIDEQLDSQIEKILKEKEKLQHTYSKML